jgi:hypothetical protein
VPPLFLDSNRKVYVCIINSAVRQIKVVVASDLVVYRCWVSSLSMSELLGVFARCAVIERTSKFVSL